MHLYVQAHQAHRRDETYETSICRTECEDVKKWNSVHKCPQCGHILKLDEIDLKAVKTGIVVCPSCGLSGPIEIQVFEREKPE